MSICYIDGVREIFVEITGTNGSPFVEYMMCFNAGAVASAGPAKTMDHAGASVIFGAEEIKMISWLASQWQSPTTSSNAIATNADINKAIWEIMADYGTGSGVNITGGSFYLNAGDGDIGDVTTWLTLALAHTGDKSHAANFLIPICSFLSTICAYVHGGRVEGRTNSVGNP